MKKRNKYSVFSFPEARFESEADITGSRSLIESDSRGRKLFKSRSVERVFELFAELAGQRLESLRPLLLYLVGIVFQGLIDLQR